MFKQAQLKLTFFYSTLFLLIFWLFSLGLYFWMERSFGESYISQVRQRQTGQNVGEFNDSNNAVVAIAGDVALNQLRNILLVLNGGLFIVIPVTSWFLAKRTLSPVQKIHEQQKQFVSDASHELRTPLSIISGELEVAMKKDRSRGDYKKILESSKEEVDRLTGLVENLLFLAKEDQGYTKERLQKIDLVDLVNSVINLLSQKIRDKGLKIEFRPPKESLVIQGSSASLRQLFFNLIENAVKYSSEGRKITVSFSQKNGVVATAIKDKGPGIASEDQKKIFDRFYRIDSSRSGTKGYGLGLAICKAIVTSHGGILSVKSTSKQGTTFTVVLPLG